MKVYLKGCGYNYAAEQIVLTVFPTEKCVFEDKYIPEDNTAYVSLSGGDKFTTAFVRIMRDGQVSEKSKRVLTSSLGGKLQRDRVLQRLIKNAFYEAALKITKRPLAWGSLTGIRPGKITTKLIEDDGEAQRVMEKEYYVSPKRARLCTYTARAAIDTEKSLGKRDIALYVGIPFCPTRCAYCSFVSQSVEKSMHLIEPFVEALLREIEAAGQVVKELSLRPISVYFGGGTPTTLSQTQLETVINKLKDAFDMSAVSEFTVEAGRPDTITAGKLEVLARSGVTRVSINPQTMSDKVLELIGRRHKADDIEEAYKMARNAGIPQVNMDLIAGLPGDTPEGFSQSLERVLNMGPENVTVHTLSLKKGSRIMLSGTEIPRADVVGEMLDICMERLTDSGYLPYYLYRQKFISGGFENVGWAKSGCESLYNILIMEELCSIIAMGGGGSTKLVARDTGRIERVFNPKYPKEYIESIDSVIQKKSFISKFYDQEIDVPGR